MVSALAVAVVTGVLVAIETSVLFGIGAGIVVFNLAVLVTGWRAVGPGEFVRVRQTTSAGRAPRVAS